MDVGAKGQIYRLIQGLTRQGMACILISSELNEVLGLSHRVAVMRGGRIVATLGAEEATEQSVMRHAAGVRPVEVDLATDGARTETDLGQQGRF